MEQEGGIYRYGSTFGVSVYYTCLLDPGNDFRPPYPHPNMGASASSVQVCVLRNVHVVHVGEPFYLNLLPCAPTADSRCDSPAPSKRCGPTVSGPRQALGYKAQDVGISGGEGSPLILGKFWSPNHHADMRALTLPIALGYSVDLCRLNASLIFALCPPSGIEENLA